VYRFAQSQEKGVENKNPAEAIKPGDIATFKPSDRALSPAEIRAFYSALDGTATVATLRLAIKFVLLTMVRKGEFIGAT
jgi:integrase